MKKYIILPVLAVLFFSGMDLVSAKAVEVSCGGIRGIPSTLPTFTSNVINLIKLIVPIILIILGMLDFFKASMSNDEKAMKASANKFVKRLIAAVLIFFVVAIVQFVFGMIKSEKNITSCVSCFISGTSNCK